MLFSINHDQRLYVIPCCDGYSCLDFDFAERRRRAVLAWAEQAVPDVEVGTEAGYAAYEAAMALGAKHHSETRRRCNAELTPELIGLEGKRVEVTGPDGYKERFWVGKSSGWMPIHLEIKSKRSTGGPGVYLPKGAKVRVVRER